MNTFTRRFSLLGTPLDALSIKEVLEYIKKRYDAPPVFTHLVSINPETVVVAHSNPTLMSIYRHADLALADGIGIILAAKLHGIPVKDRVSGSTLLPLLLDLAGRIRSRVVLIGSRANLADNIAKCYSQSYPEAKFIGISGYKNVLQPTLEEEEHVRSIVVATRPHFVFVAFGTPAQEIWIDTHKDILQGAFCMGVGGAFDYLSGSKQRPSLLIQSLGLEWLYRLITEPWRASRQLSRLPHFAILVLLEWLRCIIRPQHGKAS